MEVVRINAEKIYRFALFLVLAIIPVAVLFFWSNDYSVNAPINDGKFGTFGDFVGGVLGSIWSLCGVLLFYSALKDQRSDSDINRKALMKQIEALEIQSQEFRLQREELRESRKVFSDQSKTFRHQRFDSTYFSLLGLYKQTVGDLDDKDEINDYFKSFREKLHQGDILSGAYVENHRNAAKRYLTIFYQEMQGLGHYFKLIYRILKIIDEYDISESEKFRYAKILRSQISENELLALFYNSHSPHGKESYKLILKYNLLKHLPLTSKVEFQYYLLKREEKDRAVRDSYYDYKFDINRRVVQLMAFGDSVEEYLGVFLDSLHETMKSDDFDGIKIAQEFFGVEGFIVSLSSQESNELKIEFSGLTEEFLRKEFDFSVEDFLEYVRSVLYELFLYSRYVVLKGDDPITSGSEGEKYFFEFVSEKKLYINSDAE